MQQLYLDLNRPYQRGEQITFEFEYSPWKIKEPEPSIGLTLTTTYCPEGTTWASQKVTLAEISNTLTINAENIVWAHTNKIQKFFLRLLGIQK